MGAWEQMERGVGMAIEGGRGRKRVERACAADRLALRRQRLPCQRGCYEPTRHVCLLSVSRTPRLQL
jgi:hypothetical protein